MSDYEILTTQLEDMRSRFDNGFSSSDRTRITALYSSLFGKKIRRSGCGDCYRDAYIEIYTYLKKLGHMPKKSNYSLKAGIIVHPQGTNKFYANNNIPDDVAEEYLAKFPGNINEFASYPTDYIARVEARKKGETVDDVDTETLLARYNELKKEHEKTLAELEETKSALKETPVDDGSSVIEIETLKADLASAKEENANLKAELEKAEAELESIKSAAETEGTDTADAAPETASDVSKTAKKTRKATPTE